MNIKNKDTSAIQTPNSLQESHSGYFSVSKTLSAVTHYLHSLSKEKLKEWVDCDKLNVLTEVTALVCRHEDIMVHIGLVTPSSYSSKALITLSRLCSKLKLDPASIDVGGTDIAEHIEPLRDYLTGKIDLEYYVKFQEEFKKDNIGSDDAILFEAFYQLKRLSEEDKASSSWKPRQISLCIQPR